MGRKRDKTVEHDRLRTIVLTILDQDDLDLDLAKFARQAGFDPATTEGFKAYQAIRRWTGERAEKGPDGKPGDSFPRHLKLEYRRAVFLCVRNDHWDEYIKPLPKGERWITAEERERWYYDTKPTENVRRVPHELAAFAEFVEKEAIITGVTAHSVTAEGTEGTRTYRPAGGLTEEDYRRLADDVLVETQDELAWAVIDNVLWKKGLLRSQIRQARRLVPKERTFDLIEANSFEVVADALYEKVRKAPKKKR